MQYIRNDNKSKIFEVSVVQHCDMNAFIKNAKIKKCRRRFSNKSASCDNLKMRIPDKRSQTMTDSYIHLFLFYSPWSLQKSLFFTYFIYFPHFKVPRLSFFHFIPLIYEFIIASYKMFYFPKLRSLHCLVTGVQNERRHWRAVL